MGIKHAILGFLSWKPFSGYELKKIIATSESMHWSGNSNQIYPILVQIHKEGLVTIELQEAEHGPARKMYSITERGRQELEDWVKSAPERSEIRNVFLVQLAWADTLEPVDLDTLLAVYEQETEMQIVMCREHESRGILNPARTPREAYLWKMIFHNHMEHYKTELAWVRRIRKEIGKIE